MTISQPLPVSHALLPSYRVASSSVLLYTPTMMLCILTDLAAMEPMEHGLKPPKLWVKLNPFSFKLDVVSQ